MMSRLSSRIHALRGRVPAVAYGDVASLRRPAIWTRAVRIIVALTLAGLFAGAAVAAGDSRGGGSDLVPEGTANVLVIDLSKSILDTELATIGATLHRLIATDTATGLVVFSDVPYELLPPGSPASALVPVQRFFTPVNNAYPKNPWNATFRAGTRISAALELAHQMLLRSGAPHGSIVLVSDLQTAPSDYAALTQTLVRLRREQIVVRAVPLDASDLSRGLFASVLGPDYLLPAPRAVASPTSRARRTLRRGVPIPLLLLGGLLLVGLAANERWCARLAIPGADASRRHA